MNEWTCRQSRRRATGQPQEPPPHSLEQVVVPHQDPLEDRREVLGLLVRHLEDRGDVSLVREYYGYERGHGHRHTAAQRPKLGEALCGHTE